MTESEPPPRNSFEESLAAIQAPEERLRMTLDHMQAAISREGKPDFRTFWDTRKLCIDYFREGIHPAIRSQLWEEMRGLTAEVRRLKEHLTEQAEFAAEQLELALKSLEEEIERFDEAVASAPKLTLPMANRFIEQRLSFYDPLQRQVTRLTSWATRINALRKELIRTDMRVGRKTKLFRRLSSVGDLVFPRRKELIQEISRAFVVDVEGFAQQLNQDPWPAPPYAFRDDIRALQAFAKSLTVSSKGFTVSREILSTCWGKVQERDEEWKREQEARRDSFREVVDAFSQRISEIGEQFGSARLTDGQTRSALDSLEDELQSSGLGYRDQKGVRGQIGTVRRRLQERQRRDDEARAVKRRQLKEASAAQTELLIGRLQSLMDTLEAGNADSVEEAQAVLSEVAEADLLGPDHQLVASYKERLHEKLAAETEEQRLMQCAGSSAEASVLAEILSARRERRASMRERVEILRREAGSSGLDFEAAMTAQEQLEAQRERLSTLDCQIDAVRDRINSLKK